MSELALKLIREAKETHATRLDLGNCGLTQLSDELFELTWLEELNLCSEAWYYDFEKNTEISIISSNGIPNNFKKIPTEFSKLEQLRNCFKTEK